MRILVVEDNPDTLRWLQLHLEDLGYTVFTANDLAHAQAALNENGCDILISDVLLPDGTGWELLERSKLPKRPLAIAMSGIGRNIDATRSYGAGFKHHLFKPFPLAYLDRLLEDAAV